LDLFLQKMFTNDEHKVLEEYLAQKEEKGEYSFTSVTFKQPVRVRWERRGDLILGVIYYNEIRTYSHRKLISFFKSGCNE
jgi:hypothetical protein